MLFAGQREPYFYLNSIKLNNRHEGLSKKSPLFAQYLDLHGEISAVMSYCKDFFFFFLLSCSRALSGFQNTGSLLYFRQSFGSQSKLLCPLGKRAISPLHLPSSNIAKGLWEAGKWSREGGDDYLDAVMERGRNSRIQEMRQSQLV